MKILTVVNGNQLGRFEDSRGMVGASRVRKEYADATKALRRARRNARENENVERQEALNTEVVKSQEVLSLAEKAVADYTA